MTDEQKRFIKALSLSTGDFDFYTSPLYQYIFSDNGYLSATNGHHLLRIKSRLFPTKTVQDSNKFGPDAQSVIPTKLDIRRNITFDELMRVWDNVPMTEKIPCEDCNGEGTVQFTYESVDGETYYTRDTCPVCGGSGEILLEEKVKDELYPIMIGDTIYSAKEIHWLLRVMDVMQLKEVTLRSQTSPNGSTDRAYFQRDKDIDMLFMAAVFTENSDENLSKHKPLVL